MGLAPTVNVSFLWGTTRGGPYAHETTASTLNGPASFVSVLSGLAPNTTYYFMAKADGGVYGVAYGNESNFQTSAPPSPNSPIATMIGTSPRKSSGGTVQSSPSQAPASLSNIIVQSVSMSDASVSPGTPVEVTVVAANRGTADGNAVLQLYVNGEVESVQGITLQRGQTTSVTFTVVRDQPGSYAVYAGGSPRRQLQS